MKIKGYKASYNGVCRDQKYEVGQTYTIDNIKMCKRGFHFCKEMNDVVIYYPYDKDFVLFEVIGSGEMITEGNKTVCSQIEIIRIVPQEEYTFPIPLMEYDDNGNLIHYKNSDGYEYWQTFDVNNNVIHYKNSNGYEYTVPYKKKSKFSTCIKSIIQYIKNMKTTFITLNILCLVNSIFIILNVLNAHNDVKNNADDFGVIPIQMIPIGKKLVEIKQEGNDIIFEIAPMNSDDIPVNYTIKYAFTGMDIKEDHIMFKEMK